MAARCYLFVPGDRPDMLAKAATRGADAIIIDVEDAVAPAAREEALHHAAAWVRSEARGDVERWVRIPRVAPGAEIATVFTAGLTGVMVPKARSVADVEAVAAAARHGDGELRMLVLIETAAALRHVEAIAAYPGVARLMSGEMDMAAALGIALEEDEAWWPIRSRIVAASAAAGLPGPIAPVDADFRDPTLLEGRARKLRRHGFRAGAAIHPAQIGPYRKGFAPDESELEAARRIVELYEAAQADGRGVVVDEVGRMVDEAVVKTARRTLAEG